MVSTQFLTADDLYRLGPDAPYELIEGELIRVNPPGGIHGEVAGKLTAYLGIFVLTNRLGKFYTHDTGFIFREDPDTVLGPDFAFIRQGRLPESPKSYIRIIPDLVVEIVSPSNSKQAVERKTKIYLDARVEQVWIVDPARYEISIYRLDQSVQRFGYDDTLLGIDLLPGFELPVANLFE